MAELQENMVLQYTNEENKKVRIIWIDKNDSYFYFVDMESDTAMPQIAKVDSFIDLIESNEILTIPDPYGYTLNTLKLPEKYLKWRDQMWKIVEYLWFENRTDLLTKESRSKIIERTSLELGVTERKVRRILTRFWQRGMVKNALLPDYMNSGGEGKMKSSGFLKRGRKPEYSDVEDGINVTDQILNIIRASIRLFYRKSNRKPIKKAYEDMKKKFFSETYISGGKKKYIVQAKNTYPTYRQFYYWLEKELNIKETHISRFGKKSFDLHLRELLKNSTVETFGPGSKYQIDATIADVYLVSMIDRNRLIGRPVVYIVIDVYSRLIVGVFVGLEGPSWLGAMMALDNVVEDKVEFCGRYGIEICDKDWPNSYLPELIIADRGEFEGYNPDNLINNLGVVVRNTPPYRGDLKGIVERYFHTMNGNIKHMAPGGVLKDFIQRGERDTKYDAILDINEFMKIIIGEIIHHNKSIISRYPREMGLIADEVKPIPVEIWNWGIKNRACGFKVRERDIIRLNLLYRSDASIEREGIKLPSKLGKMYYSCEEALKEQWFINRKKEKLEIVYDPRNMNYIYIPMNKGNQYIKCALLEKCYSFKDLRAEEVVFEYELERELIEENRDNQSQEDITRLASAEEVIKEAEVKTKKFSSSNKNSRSKDMKDMRKFENSNIRIKQSIELGSMNDGRNNQSDLLTNNTDEITKSNKTGLKLNLVKEARENRNAQ